MSRLSAAHILGKSGPQKQDKPREGSKLRYYYDQFLTGQFVNLNEVTRNKRSSLLKQLRDYDLEIITKPDPTTYSLTRSHVLYKCLGIWDGDYLETLADVEVANDNTPKTKE